MSFFSNYLQIVKFTFVRFILLRKFVMMECFNVYLPQPQLSPFILYYWMLETSGDVKERTIPFGHVQLIFHREQSMYSSEHGKMQPTAFVGGMTNGYTDLSGNGKIKMLVVAFRPQGARAFLDIPVSKFHNDNISVDDLEDAGLKRLGRQVCSESDTERCIHLIESFFLKRLADFDIFNLKRISPAIDLINTGAQTVAALPETACLSQKQFNRIFMEYVGTTPKEFHRLIRFQRALFILQNNPTMSLTHVSLSAGYYDQSHFIKDFQQFSGYSPREFLSFCAPTSDYFTYL